MKAGIVVVACFFYGVFLNSCTSPEDHAVTPPLQDRPTKTSAEPSPQLHTVEIEGMKFQPEEIKVKVGDTITWVNHDMVTHCVTEEGAKRWTSSNITPGESWKMVVKNQANYHCAIHVVMKGKISVE